jgi:hypothetical protein
MFVCSISLFLGKVAVIIHFGVGVVASNLVWAWWHQMSETVRPEVCSTIKM